MKHALVTVIAPLALDRLAQAATAIDALGNPALPAIQAKLDMLDDGEHGVHFASLHAIRSQDGKRGYIVLEFSADGAEDDALAMVVRKIGDHLQPVFQLSRDWKRGDELLSFLQRHSVTVGGGWLSNPGVVFAGTPGLSVGRIRREARLAVRATMLVGETPEYMSALKRIESVRESLAKDEDLKFSLKPAEVSPPFQEPSLLKFITQLLVSFVVTYLMPVVFLVLACTVLWGLWSVLDRPPGRSAVWAFVGGAWVGFRGALWTVLVWLVLIGAVVYVIFRRAEATDSLEERTAPRDILAGMFQRENRDGCLQNHMVSVTQRKPGAIRWFTSRLVFWAVAQFATRKYRPGFLSDIGTIHFARWVTAPGSPDVLFFSNYGGSWESYLEDFITRAHAGLTAIWSNSIGFPRSENLIQRGATDGERFKRYARQSMVPTLFWYSAYPELTAAVIRKNAEIRRGLSGSMTEDEALDWLALFGSAARPADKLLSSEIQSMAFGGLGFMPHGTCLLYDLPDDIKQARKWLADICPEISFNDGRRYLKRRAALTLAFGARGLQRLGMPQEGLETFPFAFQEGMTAPSRARILGDHGDNAAQNWEWGKTQPDVAVLAYGVEALDVELLEARLKRVADAAGMAPPHRIPLKQVTKDKREAFGFIDGISQPLIRGTYKSLRNPDSLHIVEPGEFILGYPDNRGNVPPGPTLPATADVDNMLPLVGGADNFADTVVEKDRDIGSNGSFLVIRQLEQDVAGFNTYCEAEAARFQHALPEPYQVTSEFIAAKLIGRWRDGSSLARYPYEPRSLAQDTKPTQRPRSNPADAPSVDPAPAKPKVAAAQATSTARSGGTIQSEPERSFADNDFLFGAEDPEALRCPFGSHIRRANPRESLVPGSAEQVAISNRHRILRVGRQYEDTTNKTQGLLFMCLNGDIERQFEFVQQTWLMSPSFHGLASEKDPVLGDGEASCFNFTIPSRYGPLTLSQKQRFVSTKGGGYFFMPGKRLIDFLSKP